MSEAVRVRVETSRPYEVHVGSGLLKSLAPAVEERDALCVLTDENVESLHGKSLELPGEPPRIVVAAGEDSKSLARLEDVLDAMLEAGLSRASCLVAFGGGVVGDLGGLASALFQRGIDFVQVPTTLLSQVDSSVGGKTAVNLRGGKNLAGCFHQPIAVYADCDTLRTLPENEFLSGMGEVLKSALLGDAELLEFLENEHAAVRSRESAAMIHVVERCVRVKARVVASDEREAGPRKALNLGHTFAHAIEHAAGYGVIPHGIAVATGLVLAARTSAQLSLCDEALAQRVERLVTQYSLPGSLEALRQQFGAELAPDALQAGMRHDKKGAQGEPRFVLLEAPEQTALDVAVDPATLAAVLS